MTTFDNSYFPCEESFSDAFNCDDGLSCGSSTLSYDGAPICITGHYGCGSCTITGGTDYTMDNVTSVTNTEASSFFKDKNINTAIRCDGYNACAYSSKLSTKWDTYNESGGNIYLSGTSSGSWVTTDGIDTNDDVFCTGYSSCEDSLIQNANNLYCTGSGACESSSIYNVTDVYCYGYQGCQDSTIENINNNVYCSGVAASCYDATLRNINGNVYVSGYGGFGLSGSVINVNQSVYIIGDEVAYGTIISNIGDYVICSGSNACREAVITNIGMGLKAFGKNSLRNSNIFTGGNNNTITIEINGTQNYDIDIYCNETDICQIDCQSQDACRMIILHCESATNNEQCMVKCDGDDITCPFRGDNWVPWIATTTTSASKITSTTVFSTTDGTDTTTDSISTTVARMKESTEVTTSNSDNIFTTTSGTGGSDGENNSDNSDSSGLSDSVAIVLIVSITLVLIFVILGLGFGYRLRLLNNDASKHETHLAKSSGHNKVEMEKLASDGDDNDNDDANLNTNDQHLSLQKSSHM